MRRWLWLLCLYLALSSGCTITPVHRYDLSVRLLNDDNRTLTLEGNSNLPDEAPIEATLIDPEEDVRLAGGEGKVRDSRFFVVLDISKAPGGKPLQLEVAFDPMIAPLSVKEQVGPRGVGMGGELVEEEGGRSLLVRRLSVLFPMESREAALRAVDPSNPGAGIRRMEDYVSRNPQDTEAMQRLALVLLGYREPERHAGSRAHALLQRAYDLNPTAPFVDDDARLWLLRLDAEARELEAQRRLQQALDEANPRRRIELNSQVVPGVALGGVRLGTPAGALFQYFWPQRFPSYRGSEPERIPMKDLYDVVIEVDPLSRAIVSASTENPFFQVDGRFGVGSVLPEVRQWYPDLRPVYGEATVRPDGYEVCQGEVELEGLRLKLEKVTDPVYRLPVVKVTGLEVFLPPDPEALRESDPGPETEAAPEPAPAP